MSALRFLPFAWLLLGASVLATRPGLADLMRTLADQSCEDCAELDVSIELPYELKQYLAEVIKRQVKEDLQLSTTTTTATPTSRAWRPPQPAVFSFRGALPSPVIMPSPYMVPPSSAAPYPPLYGGSGAPLVAVPPLPAFGPPPPAFLQQPPPRFVQPQPAPTFAQQPPTFQQSAPDAPLDPAISTALKKFNIDATSVKDLYRKMAEIIMTQQPH